jgi:CRISPR-associated endonuclease/helicase Cas3
VDIDFPALYRAYAGLDSLVQAAGRCNREGRMELGQVYVFQAPTAPPPGVLRQGLETMKVLQAARGTAIELSSPAICDEYFRSFYSMAVSDARGVQAAREQMEYYTVASRFRLIDDGMTTTIIVSYGERAQETIRRMETEGPRRDTFRALQPFSVRVYPQAARRLKEAGAVEELPGRIWYLLAPFAHLYDDDYGLSATGLLVPDASSTII